MRLALTAISAALVLGFSVTRVHAASLASWTFETSVPTTAGPHTAEGGVFGPSSTATGVHASSSTIYTNPAGNGTAESFASDRWAIGDYWQFKTASTGYENIRISFDQGSSNTGPKDFTLSYSTDGTTFTAFGDYSVLSYAVSPAWSAGTYQSVYSFNFDLSSIATLDNDSDIYFRLSMRTTTAAGSVNPVGTGGLNRVDTVTITGDLIPPVVPLPGAVFGGMYLLAASTFFRRRR